MSLGMQFDTFLVNFLLPIFLSLYKKLNFQIIKNWETLPVESKSSIYRIYRIKLPISVNFNFVLTLRSKIIAITGFWGTPHPRLKIALLGIFKRRSASNLFSSQSYLCDPSFMLVSDIRFCTTSLQTARNFSPISSHVTIPMGRRSM